MCEEVIENPLGTERIGKLIFRFAVPSIIAIVVNSLYNMVDQVFIGRGVGYLGNAATNVIMPFTIMQMALAQMLGDGAAAWMSLNLGQGDSERAAKGTGNAITITVVLGIVMMILCEIFMVPLCQLFGASENVLNYAVDYGRNIVLGFPFFSVACAYGSIIRADGRPNASMVGLLIGCVVNIVLDPIFILVFHWGVKGAALATIIGQILNAAFYLVCILKCRTIQVKKRDLIWDGYILGKILSLGLSSFITQVAAVIVILVLNNALVGYGANSIYGSDIPLATLGITMKVSQLITGIALGIAVGCQPIWGYNYGNGQYERVKKTYKLSILLSTLVLLVALLIFQFAPEYIINLFGKESELYVEFAVMCFRIFLLLCPVIGINIVTGIFFQSTGYPIQSAALSLSRQILFLIPAVIILARIFGVVGVLWAGPVGDGLSAMLSIILVGAYWKRMFLVNKISV